MHEGELESMKLAELLRSLGGTSSSGVLRLYSTGGRQKVVELTGGRVSAVARGEEEPLDLGCLLVESDRADRQQLAKAKSLARTSDCSLGEALDELGHVNRADLDFAVWFFVSEEVADLLFWGTGRYRFAEGARLDAAPAGDVLRPSQTIDPALIMERFERSSARWSELTIFLPEITSVLRLTPQGKDVLATVEEGTRAAVEHVEEWVATYAPEVDIVHLGRRLLELVDDGWNVRAITIKTSTCRLGVLGALAELVRAGLAEEVQLYELKDLAVSLERERKYAQSICAYQALLAGEDDPYERAAFRRAIGDCEKALEVIAATEEQERARSERWTISRKRGFVPESWGRNAAALLLVLVILVGVAIFSIPALRRIAIGEDMLAFDRADAKAKQSIAMGDHVAAICVYQAYISSNPEGAGRELARARAAEIAATYNRIAAAQVRRASKLEAERQFAKAAAVYRGVLENFDSYKCVPQVRDRLRATLEKQAQYVKEMTEKDLTARLERAAESERRGELTDAKLVLAEVASAEGDFGARAKEGLRRLAEIDETTRAAYRLGLDLEEAADFEGAVESFDEAAKAWPRSKTGRDAALRSLAIQRKMRVCRLLYDEAKGLASAGRMEEAVKKYLLVRRSFPRFKEAALAEARTYELSGLTERLESLLAEARAHEEAGRGAEAFGLYRKIMDGYPRSSVVKTLQLTVTVRSVPSGAKVWRGGELLGNTPLRLTVGALESGEIALSADGFEPLAHNWESVREPEFLLCLQRTPLWTTDLGSRPTGRLIVTSDRIYVPAGTFLVAVERSTGQVLWRTDVWPCESRTVGAETKTTPLRGVPAHHDGKVYVATGEGRVVAIDEKDGRIASKIDLGAPLGPGLIVRTSRLLGGRPVALVADASGRLRQVDLARGAVVGEAAQLGLPPVGEPTLLGRLACYTIDGTGLVAADMVTGKLVWRLQAGGMIAGAGPAGKAVLAAASGSSLRLVSADGGVACARRLQDADAGWPCIGGAAVAAPDGRGRIRGFSLNDLTDLWTADLDGVTASPPAYRKGRFYCGTRSGSVWCIDEGTGEPLWRYRAGGGANWAVAVADDLLIVCSARGRLAALRTARLR